MRLLLLTLLSGCTLYAATLSSRYFLSLTPKHRGESLWFVSVALAILSVPLSWRRHEREPAGGGEIDRWELAAALGGGVTAAFALYWTTLSLGLLSDDFVLLSRAGQGAFLSRSEFVRPVPLLLWAAADRIAASGWPLHAVNVVLHGVNAAFVFRLSRGLGLSRSASLGAGLLFVSFPASVEAVAWASGLQDILATTGCLGFVLACRAGHHAGLRLAACMICLALALGSKETAAVVPLLALVMLARSPHWHRGRLLWAAAVTCLWVVLRLTVFHVDASFAVTPSRYFVKEFLSRLFAGLAVPFTAAELAHWPGLGIGMACGCALLLLLGAWRVGGGCGPRATAARALLWVVCSALPVWSMFYVSGDLQGGRYLYLPACGWSIALAAMVIEPPRWRRAGIGAAGALTIVWSVGVYSHLVPWKEAAAVRDAVLTSAIEQVEQSPCTPLVFGALPDSVGGAYVFRNGFREALRREGVSAELSAASPAGEPDCVRDWDGKGFR